MTHRSYPPAAREIAASAVIGAAVLAAALFGARWIDQAGRHATLAPNMPFFQAPALSPPLTVPPAVS